METTTGKSCCCPCHKMPGILVTLFGLSFLLKNAGIISDSLNNYVWPSLILIGGIQKIFAGCCKCCSNGAPGAKSC